MPLRPLLAALALICVAVPAEARVYFGVGVGAPLYGYHGPPSYYYAPRVIVPPTVYAPPPAMYAPPPVWHVPPSFGAPAAVSGAYVQSCDAGAYRCPMDLPTQPGAACYCSGNRGQKVWGAVR